MSATKGLGLEIPPSTQWLYRKGELVLGPLSEPQLIEKMFAGEIDGRTEISPLGEAQFRPVGQISGFKVHLAKAEAKLRVDAVHRADQLRARRRRNVAIAIVATLATAVGGAAAVGARYFAVHNPFAKVELAEITVEPPTITRSRTRGGDDELVAYPGRLGHSGGERGGRLDRAARLSSGRVSSVAEDSDGMQMAKFDQSAINSVVAARQKSLYSCFGEEAHRNPAFAGKVPIEFVIGNDGHVSKLWVDHPDYKEGPLADCLFRELQRWPFKPYEGEQATVGLSFKIRGKG